MEQDMKENWENAINTLMEMPKSRRDHFALLLLNLAKCYSEDNNWKAVVLIDNDEAMITFSAGADEMEAAHMLEVAYNASTAVAMADAPAKEMYN